MIIAFFQNITKINIKLMIAAIAAREAPGTARTELRLRAGRPCGLQFYLLDTVEKAVLCPYPPSHP